MKKNIDHKEITRKNVINAEIIKMIKVKITKYMSERNWSSNRLADEADISASSITNWYKRNTVPSLEAIIKICVALGIAVSEFFNEKDKPIQLTDEQQKILQQWDLMHKQQKEDFLRTITNLNATTINLKHPI